MTIKQRPNHSLQPLKNYYYYDYYCMSKFVIKIKDILPIPDYLG